MKRKTIKQRNRSGKFPCDICKDIGYLEEHHIEGRDIPDYNHKSNLCNICPNCHYKIHLGVIVIEQWAMSSVGITLLWHNEGENPDIRDAETHIIQKK